MGDIVKYTLRAHSHDAIVIGERVSEDTIKIYITDPVIRTLPVVGDVVEALTEGPQ